MRSRALAAVGELGAGVAHEINNPLTGVLGLAQLLLMELPREHPAHLEVTRQRSRFDERGVRLAGERRRHGIGSSTRAARSAGACLRQRANAPSTS